MASAADQALALPLSSFLAAATAGAAASAGMPATAATPPSHGARSETEAGKVAPALTYNSERMTKVAERLSMYMEGRIFVDPRVLEHLVYCLARGVDFAISNNSIPSNAKILPSLIKQLYQHCICNDLQPAVMVLMVSTKSACRNQWFHAADADELLRMANELLNIFCSTLSGTLGGINALEAISKVIPRFYPRLKLCRLVLSLEAQPGYDVLMSDFHIPRDLSAGERIKLLVIQTNNLDTSSCIVSPPQVSFLVNGKGVERRTAVSQCHGPQFPTDISKMLKYGTNILQAVGYFGGNYLIAIAFISSLTPVTPVLEDYVQAVDGTSSDSELIVDASRISLNCPISFRRIKTPVKGNLCKHYQCFDYDNFIAMNSRSPYWRCPCCNQSVSFIDLRIDRKIVKILEEVKEDVADVVISTDGSWNGFPGHSEIREKPRGEDTNVMEHKSVASMDIQSEILDLTLEQDGEGILSDQDIFSEIDDRKPFGDNQGFQVSKIPSPFENGYSTLPLSCNDPRRNGTLESVVPNSVLSAVATDVVSPALGREATVSIGGTSLPLGHQALHVPRLAEGTQSQRATQPTELPRLPENFQSQRSHGGVSITNGRPSMTRNVSYAPVSVQALPASTNRTVSSHPTRTNVVTTTTSIPSSLPTTYTTYQSDALSAASSYTEKQQYSITSELSMPQKRQRTANLPTYSPINCIASSGQQGGVGISQDPMNSQIPQHQQLNLTAHQLQAAPGVAERSVFNHIQHSQWDAAAAAATLHPRPPQQYARHPLHPQTARVAPSGGSHVADILKMPSHSQDRPWNPIQASMSTDGVMPGHMPPEKGWQASGRMRGSLSAQEASAAINHYFPSFAQVAAARSSPASAPPPADGIPYPPTNVAQP